MATEFITTPLASMLDRAAEWRSSERLIVSNGDVASAFDHMTPELVAKALLAGRVHRKVAAAMVRENSDLSCHPEFQGILLELGIPFNRCFRQGGVESAYCWNMVMYMILDLVVPVWHESEYGIVLNGRRYSHAVWADNVWLLATCPRHFQSMVNSLTTLFHEYGLEWKLDSLMFMDSRQDETVSLTTSAQGQHVDIPAVEGMPVLGTWLDIKEQPLQQLAIGWLGRQPRSGVRKLYSQISLYRSVPDSTISFPGFSPLPCTDRRHGLGQSHCICDLLDGSPRCSA